MVRELHRPVKESHVEEWGNVSLKVLVADDERINRETTLRQLRDAGYPADAVDNAFTALERLDQDRWDVVLTDLRMPNMDGLELMKTVQQRHPGVDVILMTAFGTVETAVAAMQRGAVDYLTKPFSFRELDLRLRKLAKLRETQHQLDVLHKALDEGGAQWGIVGKSGSIRGVCELIEMFADNPAPVLVKGETGTGKELVARALHQQSSRADGPFVAVGCGAIPKDVAESEIFGHEKGAFTGAIQRRKGSFERAHLGTLLLDDIDDLPPEIQAKLLRVLQDGMLHRVGGETEIRVDVRVIVTTKVDLGRLVEEGRFRKDIFYRLRGLEIDLPPLRERGEDILLLAQHFLRLIAAREEGGPKQLTPAAGDLLRRYPWPGNVRELKRILESAVALCRGPEIAPSHLPEYIRETGILAKLFTLHLGDCDSLLLSQLLEEFEGQIINWAMTKSGGEQQRAAEILGLPRTTLQSKLARRRPLDS